ncbi:MAG: mechanosensitive ion channel family protein [Bacteroidetes bacterium]|jgi:small conductance mechanosensitive channel|nr:mechanosensitive ion channel family protein [Bacteroidota bacterium]
MKLDEFYHQFHVWVVNNGQSYVFGLIILFIGFWAIKLIKTRLRARLARNEVDSALRPFFVSLTITSLYVLLVYIVFKIIGFELSVLSTVFGAITVAVGLALSGTFQNFAGGVLILLLKPFELHDDIVAQGQEGVVTSIQLFYTVVLTYDNRTVIIPNGKLFNEVIVNVNREGKRRVDFELKLGYIVEVDQVNGIINKAIKDMPGVLSKPAPVVGVIALELDGIRFTVRVWVNTKDYFSTKIKLQEKIIKDLREADVKLPTHHLLPGT